MPPSQRTKKEKTLEEEEESDFARKMKMNGVRVSRENGEEKGKGKAGGSYRTRESAHTRGKFSSSGSLALVLSQVI